MAMHLQYIVATDDSLRPAGVVVFEICGDERYPITRHGTGLIDLFAYSLFNLADDVLNFSGVFFSNAISFQVGVLRELAGLLPVVLSYVLGFIVILSSVRWLLSIR
jgi:hypothetical protein